MRALLKYPAAMLLALGTASAAYGQVMECGPEVEGCYPDFPSTPTTPTTPVAPSAPNTPPPVLTATCETAGGYGLMAFLDDPALLVNIRAVLAQGGTVMADVDGTQVTRISSAGRMHVIAVVDGPGGRPVICYQSF